MVNAVQTGTRKSDKNEEPVPSILHKNLCNEVVDSVEAIERSLKSPSNKQYGTTVLYKVIFRKYQLHIEVTKQKDII